ncbi:hypothetical protein RHSIM_RhsimUnG0003100 [Rhododendron simsii]|uniref:Integrase zinc-binding domain-containing protein n=1 Tax=Rhododendron simsii TaxID=118357 RepID=A0A834FX97_RHOSS|nr:hypothetical protein RHSIM_RhsimUnG0003100 [Rhododendron simsii]
MTDKKIEALAAKVNILSESVAALATIIHNLQGSPPQAPPPPPSARLGRTQKFMALGAGRRSIKGGRVRTKHKLLQKQLQGIVAQVFALHGEEQSEIPNTGVEDLLTKFEIVFQDSKGLPPSRTHDDPIPLKPGVDPPNSRPKPPNSRPYRSDKENKASWQTDLPLQQIIADLIIHANSHAGYPWDLGVLTHKGHWVVGDLVGLRTNIITEYHNTAIGGHSGIDKTTRRIKRIFYWKGLQKDIKRIVSECDVCQRFKGENVHVPGLLQPLPIPERLWPDISMDFIEGLPKSHGKTTIFVVVDWLTKYAYFMALRHPYTAKDVAQLVLDNVYKLHVNEEGVLLIGPVAVLDRGIVKRNSQDELKSKLDGAKDCLNQTLTKLELSKNETKASYQHGYNEGINVVGAPETSPLWTENDLPSSVAMPDEDVAKEEDSLNRELNAQGPSNLVLMSF